MKYHYSLCSVAFSILPSGGAYSPCLRVLLDPAQRYNTDCARIIYPKEITIK